MGSKETGVVYSTEHGRMCPSCGNPQKQCSCSTQKAIPKGDGVVRVSRQVKGRKGKGVTLITGLQLAEADLKKLCKELKKRCGTGGTVKDGVIEIQGEQRDLMVELLSKKGYTAKKAGG